MQTTDQELDELLDGLISKEVFEIESLLPPPTLYKYYSPERLPAFCDSMLVRFTQPSKLNDPFEFSKRWEQQISNTFIDRFSAYLETYITRMLNDDTLLIEQLVSTSGGFPDTLEVRNQLRQLLATPQGKQLKSKFQKSIPTHMFAVSEAFQKFANSNNVLERIRTRSGVFSMSEAAHNEQLWALYASEGAGFALELDTQSKFFFSESGNCLIKRVQYSDESIPSLFENPYYVFLVKKEKWAFESEWRAIKELTAAETVVNSDVHLWRLPRGAVRSIIFGYKMNERDYAPHTEKLSEHDPAISFKKVELDFDSNALRVIELNT